MASWGNQGEQQYEQTMDSNGQKLIVSRNADDRSRNYHNRLDSKTR